MPPITDKSFLTELAGLSFRPKSAKEAVDELSIGDELFLEREPDNQYDSNAIKIFTEGDEFIGYVRKDDNLPIAKHMDAGLPVKCEVVSFLGTRKPGLKIELLDEAEG